MDIKLIVDRIENDQAILKTPDNQNITWPVNKLPTNIQSGEALTFKIVRTEEGKADEELAKNILNEILKTN